MEFWRGSGESLAGLTAGTVLSALALAILGPDALPRSGQLQDDHRLLVLGHVSNHYQPIQTNARFLVMRVKKKTQVAAKLTMVFRLFR
jgi:hypothetical protein